MEASRPGATVRGERVALGVPAISVAYVPLVETFPTVEILRVTMLCSGPL